MTETQTEPEEKQSNLIESKDHLLMLWDTFKRLHKQDFEEEIDQVILIEMFQSWLREDLGFVNATDLDSRGLHSYYISSSTEIMDGIEEVLTLNPCTVMTVGEHCVLDLEFETSMFHLSIEARNHNRIGIRDADNYILSNTRRVPYQRIKLGRGNMVFCDNMYSADVLLGSRNVVACADTVDVYMGGDNNIVTADYIRAHIFHGGTGCVLDSYHTIVLAELGRVRDHSLLIRALNGLIIEGFTDLNGKEGLYWLVNERAIDRNTTEEEKEAWEITKAECLEDGRMIRYGEDYLIYKYMVYNKGLREYEQPVLNDRLFHYRYWDGSLVNHQNDPEDIDPEDTGVQFGVTQPQILIELHKIMPPQIYAQFVDTLDPWIWVDK